MFGLNSVLSTTSARDVVDQLFGKGRQTLPDSSPTSFRPLSYDDATGTTASDRALANIIAIIYNMEHAVEAHSDVSEESGHVTSATGTNEADTLDIKATSIYEVDTGDGDDTVTIKAGTLALLNGGGGNDAINAAASFVSDVDGGDGDDTIGLVSDLALGITGGAGNDTLKISADTIFGVDGGDGDDTLALQGSRIFASGGTGNDTISIRNIGSEAAELSFLKGDGKDVISTDGGLDIRFGYPATFTATTTSYAFAPEDLDIVASDNQLVIRSKLSDDAITVNFEAGALQGMVPRYSYEMDHGDYVLNVR